MRVRVQLYAMFSRYAPRAAQGDEPGKPAIELPDGATIQDALARLALPAEMPKFLFVNRKRTRDLALALADGDELGVFPPIAGG